MNRIMLIGVLVLCFAVTAEAQTRFGWQQEDAPTNPQNWIYRVYYDVGPALMGSVTCTAIGTTQVWDCTGYALEPTVWATAHMTAESTSGESLPSNVITYAIILPTIPPPPKFFRRIP